MGFLNITSQKTMTSARMSLLMLVIIVPEWALQSCSKPEPAKSVSPVLDYSLPVYTIDGALICPMQTLIQSYMDPRNHGPQQIAALYLLPHSIADEQSLGCKEWQGGVKVHAVELEQRPEGLTLVEVNGDFFTAKTEVTNNPGR